MLDQLPEWMHTAALRSQLPPWMQDPPPKKPSLLHDVFAPLTDLNDRLAKMPYFQKMSANARAQIQDMIKHPENMVGTGELGVVAPELNAVGHSLVERLLEHGGATLTRTGEHFKGSGYMVADPALTIKTTSPQEIAAFVKRADVKAALKSGGHFGKWTDPESGIAEINISHPFASEREAVAVAGPRGEKAIGHIKDGEYQGDIPVPPEKPVAAVTKYNGKEYDSRTHGQAIDQIKAERARLGLRPLGGPSGDSWGRIDDNYFRTSYGRVVNRKEALDLARANKATTEQGNRGVSELMTMPGDETLKPGTWDQQAPVARDLTPPPAAAAPGPKGFGLGGHIPEQSSLTYFRGPKTDPNELAAAYETSLKAFRHNGPFSKYLAAGSKYPGAEPWYDTRQIYRDAADVVGEGPAADRVNSLLGLHMPASTARSAPPSNLKRAFLWQQLVDQGLITPDMLRSNKVIMPEGFGHFAQNAHQSTLARSLEAGAVNPVKNPKPASFGANLTGNQQPGTFDTVMGRIIRAIDKKSGRFFGAGPDGETAPRMWAYQPLERGLADAAHEAAKKGLLNVEPGISPVAAYQSLGWHGATGSAEYGSMADIWKTLRSKSADLWGVSPAKANEMIWGEGRVPMLPLDSPLLKGLQPRPKK